jgi:hypothetical protein
MSWNPELPYTTPYEGEDDDLRQQIAAELVIAAEKLRARGNGEPSKVLASTEQKDLSPALSDGTQKALFFTYDRVRTTTLNVPFYGYDEHARMLQRNPYGDLKVIPIETVTAIHALRNILHELQIRNQFDV